MYIGASCIVAICNYVEVFVLMFLFVIHFFKYMPLCIFVKSVMCCLCRTAISPCGINKVVNKLNSVMNKTIHFLSAKNTSE